MKINSKAFGASGAAAERKIEEEGTPNRPSFIPSGESAGAHQDAEAVPTLDAAEPAQITETVSSAASAPSVPMFTRPRKNTPQPAPAEVCEAPKDEAKDPVAQEEPKPKSRLRWSWPKKRTQSVEEPTSTAKVPNKSRPMVIVAGVFVVGAIVGPWVAQKSNPVQTPAAGPNPAVQAVADTLKGGALGSAPAVPGGTAAIAPAPVEASQATTALQPQINIPTEGEERYTAMLERMKQGGSTPQDALKIVPKLNPAAAPVAPSTARNATVAPQVDPYPKDAIPLAIENGAGQVKVDTKPIAIERSLAPSGNYIVLRIERNAQGTPAALMMPIGGRQALDAAWVFIGDATTDGMVIENITANTVVVKTANGRSIQLALH